MVTLAAAGWQAILLPALGGAVATLRHRGIDILRPTLPGATDPLETASFALVPYANRIAHGRFAFGGRKVSLPRNFGDHPHPLHGVGWKARWTIEDVRESTATLRLAHRPDIYWPWAFVADQRFTLGNDGFEIRLTLENSDGAPMPAGLGFHPYFTAAADTRFRADVAGAWLADADQLPTQRVAADHFGDWSTGDGIARPDLVDHCHDGWSGFALIDHGERGVRLSATGCDWLHLYMPPGERFFCAEPVSHLPDAVNRAHAGLAVLGPGETMTATMRIEIA